ncbi:MAG: threonine aldolase [Synergistaceae bacterium]|nr:threonine aldolase [Synergistaceae bacterium]
MDGKLDFRSDTVTQPTDEMRRAMFSACVGDDVMGDDPSVNALQEYAAGLVGMESALYVCSGTMGNLVAILAHTRRGDGVMMGTGSHTWNNECGGVAGLAGVMPYPLDDREGIPTAESVRSSFKSSGNIHHAATTLLTLENTHNSSGGTPVDAEAFAQAAREAHRLGLAVHLDGARIFNAVAYFKNDVRDYASEVDSVQICLSKGLGAPMGSVLCGGAEFIGRARKYRKALGGGQRQSGIAAAAGHIALRDMRGRLHEDHANAVLLADLLTGIGIDVEPLPRRTNMVYFRTPERVGDDAAFRSKCLDRGLQLNAAGVGRIRMVTHIGLDESSVRTAADIIEDVLKEAASK